MTNGPTGGSGSQPGQATLAKELVKAVREEIRKGLKNLDIPVGEKEGKAAGARFAKGLTDSVDSVLGFGLQAIFASKVAKMSESYYDSFIKPVEKANSELAKSFTTVASAAAQIGSGAQLSPFAMQGKILADQFGEFGQKILENQGTLHNFDNALRFVKKGMDGKIQVMDLGAKAAAGLEASLVPLIAANQRVGESGAFNTEALLILQQAFSMSAEDLGKVASRAVSMGTTTEAVLMSSQKAAKKFAKAFGVDRKQITKDVGSLLKDFETFGHRSSEELAKVAATARSMGVSLEGIKKMELFDDFDKAADAAAKASQYFGIMIDPMELFLAEDEDRLKLIKERADLAGVDVMAMNRIERKVFAKNMGITVQDLVAGFSQQNQGAARVAAGTAAAGAPMTMQEEAQAVGKELKALTAAFKGGPEAFSRFTSDLAELIPKVEQSFRDQTAKAAMDAVQADKATLSAATKALTDPETGALTLLGSFGQVLARENFPLKAELIRGPIESFAGSLTRLEGTPEKLNAAIDAYESRLSGLGPKASLKQRQAAREQALSAMANSGVSAALQDVQNSSKALARGLTKNFTEAASVALALTKTTTKGAAKATAQALDALQRSLKGLVGIAAGLGLGTVSTKEVLGGIVRELEKQGKVDAKTVQDMKAGGLISAVTPGTTPAMEPGAPPVPPGAGLGGGTMVARVDQRLRAIEGKLDAVDQTVKADKEINLNVENHIALGANDVTQLAMRGKITPGGPTFGRAITDATGNTLMG